MKKIMYVDSLTHPTRAATMITTTTEDGPFKVTKTEVGGYIENRSCGLDMLVTLLQGDSIDIQEIIVNDAQLDYIKEERQ